MDCRFVRKKNYHFVLHLHLIFVCIGVQKSIADECAVRQKDGGLQRLTVKDTQECCVKNPGFFTVGLNMMQTCEQFLSQREWLLPPPCDIFIRAYPDQKYFWFSLGVPNRRILCTGSLLETTNCKTTKLAIDGVVCFKHRYQKFNSSTVGCPVSSMDCELARSINDCCADRGSAGYAKHLNEWYLPEAKLLNCEPCPQNSASVTTWSQWSTCSSGPLKKRFSKNTTCTKKRFLQVPYVKNMPQLWCLETVATQEQGVEKDCGEVTPGKEKGSCCTISLIVGLAGLSISLILVGIMCFVCIRKRLKRRHDSSLPAGSTNQQTVDRSVTDGEGYLIPIRINASAPSICSKSSTVVTELSEHIYDRISFNSSVSGRAPYANAMYIEII